MPHAAAALPTFELIVPVDPVLLYFIDNPKPWVRLPGIPDSRFIDEYAEFLARNLGKDDLDRRGFFRDRPGRGHLLDLYRRLDRLYYTRKKRRLNIDRRAHLDARPKVPLAAIRRLEDLAEIK